MSRNISLAFKFILLSIAYTVPIGMLFNFMVMEKTKAIDFAELEIKGGAYLRPLNALLQNVSQYRIDYAMSHLNSAGSGANTIKLSRESVAKSLEDLLKVHDALGADLQVSDTGLAKRKREHAAPVNLHKLWTNASASHLDT